MTESRTSGQRTPTRYGCTSIKLLSASFDIIRRFKGVLQYYWSVLQSPPFGGGGKHSFTPGRHPVRATHKER